MRRRIVELLPLFLKTRFSGWTGREALFTELGLTGLEFPLLRAIVEETDPGVALTEDELCADLFNPYSTIHTIFEVLPALVAKRLITREGEGYVVTPKGRGYVCRLEQSVRAYLGTRTPLPPGDLARLAETLAGIAERMWSAPEPFAKPHQARARRRQAPAGSPALIQLDDAIYALWMARDDAHTAAWRGAGFTGPTVDLLSYLWSGNATTMAELSKGMAQSQAPEDVERGVEWLIANGYVVADGERLRLTALGRSTRDAIETETDRLYFTPWPPLSQTEVDWIVTSLQSVCEGLANP
jgi:hypothetical protein